MVYIGQVALEMDSTHTLDIEAHQLSCTLVYLKSVLFGVWKALEVSVLATVATSCSERRCISILCGRSLSAWHGCLQVRRNINENAIVNRLGCSVGVRLDCNVQTA